MIKNIRHTGIVVENLKESLSFYHMLGFKIDRHMIEESPYIDKLLSLKDVELETVKMAAPDGQTIELLEFTSHSEKKIQKRIFDIGLTHISFSVDNLQEVYEALMRKGVAFLSSPQLSPDGYAKVVFCVAPEGTYLELVEQQ